MIAPLARALAPGGRLIAIHSHGHDPGLEIIQRIWPGEEPFTTDRHALLRATKAELGSAGRDLNFGAYADARSLFRYDMHTLPSEISETIGTSTLFAAWNAAIYVAQIEDQRLSEAISSGAYLDATRVGAAASMAACGSGTNRTSSRASGISADGHARRCAWLPVERLLDRAVAARRRSPDRRCAACSIPARTVFVNNPPSVTHHDIVAACSAAGWRGLRAGAACRRPPSGQLHPRQRLPARGWPARPVSDQILLLGGDVAAPGGPVRQCVRTAGHRGRRAARHQPRSRLPAIRKVIRGSPRRHWKPRCRPRSSWLGQRGLEVSLVTQFGFEADPILALDRGAAGTAASSVRCGSAWPDRRACATLAKYAVRCGIGASLRALAHRHAAFARILTEASPAALIEALAERHRAGRAGRTAHVRLWRRAPDCGMDGGNAGLTKSRGDAAIAGLRVGRLAGGGFLHGAERSDVGVSTTLKWYRACVRTAGLSTHETVSGLRYSPRRDKARCRDGPGAQSAALKTQLTAMLTAQPE